ncbi:MAG: FAD-binding oxidoreductase [Pseudomonadota bacterium]
MDYNVQPLLQELRDAMQRPDGLLDKHEDLSRYETGARYGSGSACCVARPQTASELQAVVRACVRHDRPLVMQGANTGLVSASTPNATGRQVVVSTERLKSVLQIDAAGATARVSAGVLLSELNRAAACHDLFFPIDLGADPSLGGMAATNTGGTRLLRYGDVRQNILGLSAVLGNANADIIDLCSALRKNNSGIDLKQLFIGSGGTFGAITELVVKLAPLPRQRATALVGLDRPADALLLHKLIYSHFPDFCSAFEGMSREAMHAALSHVKTLSNPFQGPNGLPAYAVLVELSCGIPVSDKLHLEELLTDVLGNQDCIELNDAIIGRADDLWALRHSLSEGTRRLGKLVALDISLPLKSTFVFREEALAILGERYPDAILCDYGHIGDGGLHFNLVLPPLAPGNDERTDCIRNDLYELVVRQHAGSFSAEHGVGPYNQAYYDRYTPASTSTLAGMLKQSLDPQRLFGNTNFGPPELGQKHTGQAA